MTYEAFNNTLPASTGSTSEDDSVEERGVFFRRSSSQHNTLPPDISPSDQLYIDINNIKNLRILRTDTGRARAWIRYDVIFSTTSTVFKYQLSRLDNWYHS